MAPQVHPVFPAGLLLRSSTRKGKALKLRHDTCVALVLCIGLFYGLAGQASAAPRKATAHTYVVRAGDGGWWRIAQTHGVTLSQLLAANHATTAAPIRVGQTVTLPAQAHELKTPRAPGKVSAATTSAVARHAPSPAAATHPVH